MKKLILIFMAIFLLALVSCKKEGILPKASLAISLFYNPVVFHWDSLGGDWYCWDQIKIIETNGVGGKFRLKLEWIYQDQVYDVINYNEIDFRAYDSQIINFDAMQWDSNHLYDTLRASLTGTDNNGYAFAFGRSFLVSYSQTVKK